MTHTIDATDKHLGRIATQAAVFLRGKDKPDFKLNVAPGIRVEIKNASKLILPESKQKATVYKRYSGYPGGDKKRTMEQEIAKHGFESVVKKAVRGMLPDNRLRDRLLKQLIVTD